MQHFVTGEVLALVPAGVASTDERVVGRARRAAERDGGQLVSTVPEPVSVSLAYQAHMLPGVRLVKFRIGQEVI